MTNKPPSYQLTPNDFQYVNETNIDGELKCSICYQPYMVPVSLKSCPHTFCKGCIEKALKERRCCPLCRCVISSNDLEPISSPIVINMLNNLLVQCKYCNGTNICRGDMITHLQRCDRFIIRCPAADINCSWTGQRRDMKWHIKSCVYYKMGPIITQLQTNIQHIETKVQHLQHQLEGQKKINDEFRRTTKVQYTELETQSKILREQNRFIRVLINGGKPMSNACINSSPNNCQIMNHSENMNLTARYASSAKSNLVSCGMCNSELPRHQISLHHCNGGCICRKCVEKYSQNKEESYRTSYTYLPSIQNLKLRKVQ